MVRVFARLLKRSVILFKNKLFAKSQDTMCVICTRSYVSDIRVVLFLVSLAQYLYLKKYVTVSLRNKGPDVFLYV